MRDVSAPGAAGASPGGRAPSARATPSSSPAGVPSPRAPGAHAMMQALAVRTRAPGTRVSSGQRRVHGACPALLASRRGDIAAVQRAPRAASRQAGCNAGDALGAQRRADAAQSTAQRGLASHAVRRGGRRSRLSTEQREHEREDGRPVVVAAPRLWLVCLSKWVTVRESLQRAAGAGTKNRNSTQRLKGSRIFVTRAAGSTRRERTQSAYSLPTLARAAAVRREAELPDPEL
jgi:hypothetical protein